MNSIYNYYNRPEYKTNTFFNYGSYPNYDNNRVISPAVKSNLVSNANNFYEN